MAIIRLLSMVNDKQCKLADEHEYQQLQTSSRIQPTFHNPSNYHSVVYPSTIVGPERSQARKCTQVVSLVPVYLLQLCYGMNTGFSAILTPQLQELCSEFQIDKDEESWIVSIDNLATPLICILSGFLQQKFGPLRVLMFACLPYILGWVSAALATSVVYIYISRLLVGISHALLSASVYTVEISSKEMRGTFSLLESAFRCSGCLIIYALAIGLRWHKIAIFASIVPITALAAAMLFAQESPVFLLARGKMVEAHKALLKLYGSTFRVAEEIDIIQDNLKTLREGRSRKMSYVQHLDKHPEIYKPLLIVVTLSIITQFSGMSILRAYVVKIFNDVFQHSNYDGKINGTSLLVVNCSDADTYEKSSVTSEAYISAIIIGFVRLIGSLLLSKLLRQFPRRSMYFTSAAMTIASLVSFATCTIFIDTLPWCRWAALVTACFLVFSVQLGLQTLPNLLSGELFPSDVRAFCKGITRSATCCFLVIGLKMFPIYEDTFGVHGTFYFFSGVLVLTLPIAYCILPETKDMGLELIQAFFTPNKTMFYVDLPLPPVANNATAEVSDTNKK